MSAGHTHECMLPIWTVIHPHIDLQLRQWEGPFRPRLCWVMANYQNQSKQHKFTRTRTPFLPTQVTKNPKSLFIDGLEFHKDAYVGLLKARHTGPWTMTCQLTSACCLQWICILCLKSVFTQCLSFIITGRSLFWVAMLGLVVLYIYGLVSYAAYQSYFDDPESGSHCKTLFQCVVSVIRLGLIGGGGLVTVSSSCNSH